MFHWLVQALLIDKIPRARYNITRFIHYSITAVTIFLLHYNKNFDLKDKEVTA